MSELVKHEKVLKIQNIRSHNNMLASTPTNIHYWKLKFPCVLETVRDIWENRQKNYFWRQTDRDKMTEKL